MAEQFTITTISAQEDPECRVFMLGISENSSEDGDQGSYLILQISLDEPTDQDRETGMDSYCVLSHYGGTCYGGVESLELAGKTLSVKLKENAAKELGYQEMELRMVLEVQEEDRERLVAGLKRVLSYGDPKHRPTLVL